ncbi:NADH-quinone oxidoreductase subunit H [bacterium]|nr:NADH-quinone oxidoreductase subunit H [bacterium]
MVRSAVFIIVLLTAFAYLTFLERRVLAWFQWRVGPNRVGPWGLLQPVADGVKVILKQEMIPRKADKLIYMIAPVITFAAAFTMFALIPVGEGVWISNVSVAVLLFLGLSSLGAYGLILAGWSSQSRYSFLGSLRTCAQVISYELPLGLALLVPVMIVGSLNLNDIGAIYRSETWHWAYLVVLLPAGLLFLVAALAETARVPFDLPECESELVAGYYTEYSSMKYAMFPMGEYVAMCAMAAVGVHVFMGGYLLPVVNGVDLTNWIGVTVAWAGGDAHAAWGPPAFLGLSQDHWNALSLSAPGLSSTLTFMGKVLLIVLLFMWIRATLPRLRYDQLMQFGWKVLLPAGFALVFLAAVLVAFLPAAGGRAI